VGVVKKKKKGVVELLWESLKKGGVSGDQAVKNSLFQLRAGRRS
jgi:hypothetical protein